MIFIKINNFSEIVENDPEKQILEEKKSRIRKFIEKHFELISLLQDLYRKRNIKALYNGMSSSIFCSVVTNGTYFCSFKFFDKVMDFLDFKQNMVTDSIVTSLLAAILTAFLSNPIYVLNSRMTKPKSEVKVTPIKR